MQFTIIHIEGLLLGVFMFFISCLNIMDGIRMLRGNKLLIFPFQIGYLLARVTKGIEEAERLKRMHTSPEELRRYGWTSLVFGGFFLVWGVIVIFEWIKLYF